MLVVAVVHVAALLPSVPSSLPSVSSSLPSPPSLRTPSLPSLRTTGPRCCDVVGDGAVAQYLRLEDISLSLSESLSIKEDDAQSSLILGLHSAEIAPLTPMIYEEEVSLDERRAAIEGLSRSLDTLEENARGPWLTGGGLSRADATIFPSMALFSQTLPVHFGWTEWTDEALFWRRPRLHAWFELMQYERPCKEAQRSIAARLEERYTRGTANLPPHLMPLV